MPLIEVADRKVIPLHCIQQIQGRAGARQVTGVKPPEVAVSGGPDVLGRDFTVWSATPN